MEGIVPAYSGGPVPDSHRLPVNSAAVDKRLADGIRASPARFWSKRDNRWILKDGAWPQVITITIAPCGGKLHMMARIFYW